MTAVRTKLSSATMTGNMAFRAVLFLAFLSALSFASPCVAQMAKQDVYYAKEIWTGDKVIQDGMMYVVDGQVIRVGSRGEFDVVPTAKIHDMSGKVIIPGLVAAQTNLGGNQNENETLTPQIQAIDGFDFFADQSKLLKAGITSAQISPGSQRLMPGSGAVVQLAGDVIDRIVSERDSLRIVLTSASRQPPRIYEPAVGPVSEDRPLETTRPQVASLPASLAVLRQIFKQAKAGDSKDDLIVAVQKSLNAGAPVRVSATTTAEIRGAIGLAKEFGFKLILENCVGLDPFVSQFDKWDSVVAGVVLVAPSPGKITNPSVDAIRQQVSPWKYARQLLDAGIPVAIRASSDTDLPQTVFSAGQFMQGGLTAEETLAAITSTPAKLSNADTQVGMLSEKRRADFVVLSDSPFRLGSQVMETYVSGESVYKVEEARDTIVVRADKVYVGDGKFIEGNVVVKGTTVRGVGDQVSAPAGAQVRDFGNAVIVPGFVDMGAGLGFGGPISGSASLSTKLSEQLFMDDPAIKYARQQGITTALLRVNSGSVTPVAAFKLGDDVRVIGDPVAIRFKFGDDPTSSIASNDRLLKSGKAYVDSWIKYKKDLAEYEVKKAAADKKKPAAKPAAKAPEKKTDAKDVKKEEKGKTPEKKTPVKKPVPKDGDKDEVKEKKKKPLPDPITGTWDGEIDQERIPAQFRKVKMELELTKDDVTGTFTFFTRTIEINGGSYNRETKELQLTITRGENEVPVKGKLDDKGTFEGTIELGPIGESPIVATRTVDKSKKPVDDDEEEKDGDKPEKDKPVDKEKEKPGDKDEKKEKPADKDKDEKKDTKKEPVKKDDKKDEAKKDDTAKSEKPKTEELKPPKKPRENKALEPYKALFAGEIPAIVETNNLYSLKAAAELFSKKYKLRTIMVGARDLAREPDALKEFDNLSMIAGPAFSVTIDKNPPTNMPQLFATEQFPFGFQSNGTTGAGQLPSAIQFAISSGLSSIDALNGLTQNPANMLSKKMNFGRIASGKDADLVVLSGPPFEFSTKVLAVMIDGKWVYEREEQK